MKKNLLIELVYKECIYNLDGLVMFWYYLVLIEVLLIHHIVPCLVWVRMICLGVLVRSNTLKGKSTSVSMCWRQSRYVTWLSTLLTVTIFPSTFSTVRLLLSAGNQLNSTTVTSAAFSSIVRAVSRPSPASDWYRDENSLLNNLFSQKSQWKL